MDTVSLTILIGTILMLVPYIYFYFLYREPFMGIWLLSWFIFGGRIVLFDYGPFSWKESILPLTLFQLMLIINGLTFAWGTYIFVRKPFNRNWMYTGAAIFAFCIAGNLLGAPLLYKILPPLAFACFICLWIGNVFIHLQTNGIGNYIAGYALIGWGLLTLYMPYSVNISWLSPLCYLAGIILRLIIVLGILMVYLEKTRSDLAHKETHYRLLAENAVDMIYRYRLSPVAIFEYVSPAALTVTGYAPEEYYADANLLASLIYSEDQPLFEKMLEKSNLSSDLPLTLRLVRKDHKLIWIEQKYTPIYCQNGTIIAFEGILRDVTGRKNMEQVVARAEQMNLVGQMAASVAHEIRNPLTSVRGYLQMMKLKGESHISQERYDLMISELDRTNTVITEYLLLAKDKIPDFNKCCLNNIISAVTPLLQVTAGATNACIKLRLEDIPEVMLDKNEIRQLIFNIVNNGLQAMPQGGELIIRTFAIQDTVVLSISDQGTGIPPPILENLGTPFLTTKSSGNGLGLPVCYRIAQRHNALIHVETDNDGTTFFVKFPLA